MTVRWQVAIMPPMEQGVRHCSECGKEVGPDARFCPSCGAPVSPMGEGRNRRLLAVAAVGVLVGVAAGLLIFKLSGPPVTGSGNSAPSGPEIVKAPPSKSTGPPIVTLPPGNRPLAPPPDPNRALVLAYLQQVKLIELERKKVVNNLLPAMMVIASARMGQGLLDLYRELFPEEFEGKPPPPSLPQQSWNTITGYMSQLQELAVRLRSIKPPVPAKQFHATYTWAFGEYIAAIFEVRQNLERGMEGDPQQALQALQASKDELSERTRGALQKADSELAALCEKYQIPRDFAISDSGEVPITGGAPTGTSGGY